MNDAVSVPMWLILVGVAWLSLVLAFLVSLERSIKALVDLLIIDDDAAEDGPR